MKDEHVRDAAQSAAEDVPQDLSQDLAFGARVARALLATPPLLPPCLCAVRAEMGAQLGSSVAFGSGCGQALPGCHAKRFYFYNTAKVGTDSAQMPGELAGGAAPA